MEDYGDVAEAGDGGFYCRCGLECDSQEELDLHGPHCQSNPEVNTDIHGDKDSTFGAKTIELVPIDDPSQVLRFGSHGDRCAGSVLFFTGGSIVESHFCCVQASKRVRPYHASWEFPFLLTVCKQTSLYRNTENKTEVASVLSVSQPADKLSRRVAQP
jgi:hypothetical protein